MTVKRLIGSNPSQVPRNKDLGTAAFQDADNVNIGGGVVNLTTATAANLYNDTSISSNKPSLMLDFVNSKTVDPRITFTRASTATYYDGKSIVKAEENLIVSSQDFGSSSWTKTGAEVASGQLAPDTSLTASILVTQPGVTTGTFITQNTSSIIGNIYTISIYAKAGTGRNYLCIQDTLWGSAGSEVWFNLSTGIIGTIERPASHSATITSVGNGWYRCTVSFMSTYTSAGIVRFIACEFDNTINVTDNRGFISIWGAQLEQRNSATTYTPTTTSTITNYIPVLQTAPIDRPRIDFDPITSECDGLLIEESRTNITPYSQQFDQWTNLNSSIMVDVNVAPDGTLSADKIIPDTTLNGHGRYRQLTVTSSTTYTQSIYAKAAGYDWFMMTESNTLTATAYFNLATGKVATVAGTGSPSATITPVGNGWYRCSMTFTTTSSQTSANIQARPTIANDIYTFSGNGYSGSFVWGAQMEVGAFQSSYIPTTTAQVTRAADYATISGANFSSWYNIVEGTMYAEWNNTGAGCVMSVYLNPNGSIRLGNGGGNGYFVIENPLGTYPVAFTGVSLAGSPYTKLAGAYKTNDFSISHAGSTPQIDTSGNVPTGFTDLYIGRIIGGTSFLNGNIKKIAYYPKRLSNNELQEMTL